MLFADRAAAVTPEQLVRQSLANYFHDYREAATRYTYMQRTSEKSGDATNVTLSQMLVVNGVPYEKDISRNGVPLTPEQEAKEQQKLTARRNEGPIATAKHIREYRDATAFLADVPNAFTFTMLPEETIDGRANYVIECLPKPTYHPHNSRARMFAHLQAKLWIDKQDLQWTKADAKVMDVISIGWILARIGKGAEISIRQTRITDKDWMPGSIDIDGNARVMLVKNHPIHEQIVCYDFRPISTESVSAQGHQ